jgi:hypothetical protein
LLYSRQPQCCCEENDRADGEAGRVDGHERSVRERPRVGLAKGSRGVSGGAASRTADCHGSAAVVCSYNSRETGFTEGSKLERIERREQKARKVTKRGVC